jgi:Fe-S cluster biogenesis protein NfuA
LKNIRAVGDRIEELVKELGSAGDPSVAERAQELVQLLMEFYGAGLERIVQLTAETGNTAFLARLAEEPLVASLLLLHNLHPESAPKRIGRALERLRPSLASHGSDVELLGVADGVARLRLAGTGNGCGSSTVTMTQAIEEAVQAAAPELAGIEVEAATEPAPRPLIQIQVPSRRAAPARG